MSTFGILFSLAILLQQALALDQAQVRFYEAMELASTEGIPSLVRRLDSIAGASPSSPFAPRIHETILVIGLLHPGSVPNASARLAQLKGSAAGTPDISRVLKRIDILQSYYAAAAKGHPESASAALSDAVFEGSPHAIQAMADAALRARDFDKATSLALQVIENDPYSPLLSNTHMTLGLSSAYQGNAKSALAHFQRALAASELPTVYGNPRDYVFTAYRFSRATPAAVGDIFDETATAQLGLELKDPRALVFDEKSYFLLDKEMLLTVSPDGRVLDKKPVRRIEDVAVGETGKMYSITEDRIDLAGGTAAGLALTVGKKTKRITSLRSVAAAAGGDLYFLDEDTGLLRGTTAITAGSLNLTALAPVKGRLIRTDAWGNLYILNKDQKSISIFSGDGKALSSMSADPIAGKTDAIEYFALDSLNHLYILTETSVQIFAIKTGPGGLEKSRVGKITFDQRPQFRDLKVLGVSPAGELVVTGDNENNWVVFK